MDFKSKFPRDLFNELKWTKKDLSLVKIYYTNRGSPNDTATTTGDRILRIEGFLILNTLPYETHLPYHRIRKIEYDSQIIFER